MTPQEIEHWAEQADRLSRDVVFVEALKRIRDNAIEALIAADATAIHDVVRLQAKITVIDEISGELRQMIQTRQIKNQPRAIL